jgi:hypothetical protein
MRLKLFSQHRSAAMESDFNSRQRDSKNLRISALGVFDDSLRALLLKEGLRHRSIAALVAIRYIHVDN